MALHIKRLKLNEEGIGQDMPKLWNNGILVLISVANKMACYTQD